VEAGLARRGGPDFTVVINQGPIAAASAVFTSNQAVAHPIRWSRAAIRDGQARAVVLNAGGANCFTGPEGFALTHKTAEATATALSEAAEVFGGEPVSASDVLVCSTGLIGEPLPAGAVINAISPAVALAQATPEAGELSARAIMTTDSVPKMAVTRFLVGGTPVTIGGMAKGAGMLAPALATMLCVITTDALVPAEVLDRALRRATSTSFDRLDSDGCTSTNDQVTLMASGASGISPSEEEFTEALSALCLDLARQLQRDAEGSSHDITVEVRGARSEEDAVAIARCVARNNLFKAAVFGNDPNWGRVLAAIGTAPVVFDVDRADVTMNGVRVCHHGAPDRPRHEVDLSPRETHVLIELAEGNAAAEVYTNDLTHAYVHENSAYSS
jgi:glutamate N-acetyltransferase/amino-acid N-acetyltransferase